MRFERRLGRLVVRRDKDLNARLDDSKTPKGALDLPCSVQAKVHEFRRSHWSRIVTGQSTEILSWWLCRVGPGPEVGGG